MYLFCISCKYIVATIKVPTLVYKILKCITNTALKYLRNLAGTDYEFPEDDAVVSKHVGAV
jgi:hypothetical protein